MRQSFFNEPSTDWTHAALITPQTARTWHSPEDRISRIRQYNTTVAVSFVRIRLKYWCDTKDWPHTDPDQPEDFSIFHYPELMSHRLGGSVDSAARIDLGVRQVVNGPNNLG